MALLNFAHRELVARVVYFGPVGAGCNTNVEVLQQRMAAESDAGELLSFGPENEEEEARWFEYRLGAPDELPLVGVRMQVCSVPGRMVNLEWRERLIAEADGVIFVADARSDRGRANVEAMQELERILELAGRDINAVPMVLQVNHTDAHNARSADKITYELNSHDMVVHTAVAQTGEGVLATQRAAADAMLEDFTDLLRGRPSNANLVATHRPRRRTDLEAVTALMTRITGERVSPELQEAEYRALAPGPEIEVAFQPEAFVGSRPVYVLGSRIEDDAIIVDVVMDRMSGEAPRRLAVRLMNRPNDAPMLTRPLVAKLDASQTASFELPSSIRSFDGGGTNRADLPPVVYGAAGILGGAVVGLLVGFLLFA